MTATPSPEEAWKAAKCRAAGATIARQIGVSRGAVFQWKKVPAHHVVRVAELVGMQPHELRPDVFPTPREAA